MPTLEVREVAPCKKELVIEVSPDLFKEEMDKAYARIGKRVGLPGFRKGKVPKQVIKSRYAGNAEEEAINRSIPMAYTEAVRELKMTAIGDPVISNVEAGKEQSPRFSATVEFLPDFKINRFTGFEFKWEIIRVTDEDIDREMARCRESFSELEDVSGRSAQKGDYVIIDYKGLMDGKPFAGGERKGVQLCLGEDASLPGLEAGIIGMSLGDRKEIETAFPENHPNKELAGKPARFEVILNEIKIKNFPVWDDAFVRENFQEEGLQAFRASIRKRMEEREEARGKRSLMDAVYSKIYEANPFDFPESLVDSQARLMAYNGLRSLGFSDEMMRKEHEKLQKITQDVLPAARTSVIRQLIAEKIKETEKLEVTEEELHNEWKKAGNRTAGGEREDARRDYLRAGIMDAKLSDFLIAGNKIEKVYIDRSRVISDNKK